MKCNQSGPGFELVAVSISCDDNHYTTDIKCDTIAWFGTICNTMLGTAPNVIFPWPGTVCNTMLSMAPNVILSLGPAPFVTLSWHVTKCSTIILGTVTKCVPILCFKDPQIGNDTIHLELLRVGVICWNK